jgi:hypothetical protein
MYQETIHANPNCSGSPQFDTVLVSTGGDKDIMLGLLVACVWLFFSYFDPYLKKNVLYALVIWFIHSDDNPVHDDDTNMWKVSPEHDEDGQNLVQVIYINTILHGVHLLPYYGEGFLPVDLTHNDALDVWDSYFVNQFIDYHAHKLLL